MAAVGEKASCGGRNFLEKTDHLSHFPPLGTEDSKTTQVLRKEELPMIESRPNKPVTDVADVSQRFSEMLRDKVDEIFNPQIAFVPTDDRNRCRYCPYKLLCSIK